MKYLEKHIREECKKPIYTLIDEHINFLKSNFNLKYDEDGVRDNEKRFGCDLKDVIRGLLFSTALDNTFLPVTNTTEIAREQLRKNV